MVNNCASKFISFHYTNLADYLAKVMCISVVIVALYIVFGLMIYSTEAQSLA